MHCERYLVPFALLLSVRENPERQVTMQACHLYAIFRVLPETHRGWGSNDLANYNLSISGTQIMQTTIEKRHSEIDPLRWEEIELSA